MDLDSTPTDPELSASADFDPRTATVEAFVSRFPDVGLFAAEDIVAYRDRHGTFPDLETLTAVLGIEADLAEILLRDIDTPARSALGPDFTAQPGDEAVLALPVQPQTKEGVAAVSMTEAAPPGDTESLTPAPAVASEAPAAASGPPAARAAATPPALSLPVILETSPQLPLFFSEPPIQVVLASVVPAPPRKRSRMPLVVGALVVLNAVLGGGMFHLHREHRRAVAPIAAIGNEIETLKHQQEGTQAKAEETRTRVAKQEAALTRTEARVEETAKRLALDEGDSKERDARTAREMAALNSRMRHVERGVVDGAYALPLTEAVKVIDAVRPPPPQRPAPKEPSPRSHLDALTGRSHASIDAAPARHRRGAGTGA